MSLVIEDIDFKYKNEDVLNKVSLKATKGELISIIGPNGSGKTTFIKCINKILKPYSGSVKLHNKDIHSMKREEIAKYIAYVPQMTNDFFSGTVMDLVLMGRRPYINWRVSNNDINIVFQILGRLDILDLAEKNYDELSGGQKQKVLIARSLAQDTEVYLLDEPTSFLDIKNQIEVLKNARQLAKEDNKIVVIVVHDLNMAMRYSDKVLMMKNGQVVAYGSPKGVLTKSNISNVYDIDVDIENNCIVVI